MRNVNNNKIDLFLFEACSNPSGLFFNFNILKKFPSHTKVVCDNTWLSPALFNPIKQGADVIVESMTKYISGGTCIGGLIIGKKN